MNLFRSILLGTTVAAMIFMKHVIAVAFRGRFRFMGRSIRVLLLWSIKSPGTGNGPRERPTTPSPGVSPELAGNQGGGRLPELRLLGNCGVSGVSPLDMPYTYEA